MAASKKDWSAFPLKISDNTYYPGLSRRELFSLVALHGLLEPGMADLSDKAETVARENVLKVAVRFADGLLLHLSKIEE